MMPAINTFNLIDNPWIPIVGCGKISLRQLFSSLDYRELGGNPIQKISLMKLLLAIAQAACTPEDDQDWHSIGPEGLAKKCLEYLEEHHDAFWLYGRKPFLQIPGIVKAEKKEFGTCIPEIATGNTTVLTQFQKETPLNDADKALLIITLMGFGLGGKKTDNKISLSEGYNKSPTGKPGTHLGYYGYLHSFLTGKTILTSIWLNLFTKEQVESLGYPNGIGSPPWMDPPIGENCSIAQSLKKSLMGRLIPFSRFCLLAENGMYYSEGIIHPTHKEGGINPSISVNRSKKEAAAIWVDPAKRPWRWITALLSFIAQGNQSSWDCPQIRLGLTRARESIGNIGIWSGGLKVSSDFGEQYVSGIDDYVESHITLPSEFIGTQEFERLKLEMDQLEYLSKELRRSIKAYFKCLGVKETKQSDVAARLFWELCEKKFDSLFEACAQNSSESIRQCRKHFAGIARKAFDMTCPMDSERQLEAWAKCGLNLKKYLVHPHNESLCPLNSF